MRLRESAPVPPVQRPATARAWCSPQNSNANHPPPNTTFVDRWEGMQPHRGLRAEPAAREYPSDGSLRDASCRGACPAGPGSAACTTSLDPWIPGSLDPWIPGSLDPCAPLRARAPLCTPAPPSSFLSLPQVLTAPPLQRVRGSPPSAADDGCPAQEATGR
jgi:hypothetical protein